MELSEKQYRLVEKLLPVQRGNVKVDNRNFLEALIYRCRKGCPWRGLPANFGNWHTLYMRHNRWAKSGVLERVYAALAMQGLKEAHLFALDSTAVKVHPNAHGAQKKTAYRP